MAFAILVLSGCAASTLAPSRPEPPPQARAPLSEMPAARLTVADIGALPVLNSVHGGTLPMLGRAIPLPGGTWRVLAEQKNTFAGYPPGATVMLVRVAGSRLTGVLEVAGNPSFHPAPAGWPLNPVCQAALASDAGLLAGDPRATTPGGDQDCVALTSQPTASWRTSGARMRSLDRCLHKLGIISPPILLLVAFGETDRHARLIETLWLPPAAGANHRQEDVDRIMGWAEGWRGVARAALGAGFDGKNVALVP